jgi:hypothetical protein
MVFIELLKIPNQIRATCLGANLLWLAYFINGGWPNHTGFIRVRLTDELISGDTCLFYFYFFQVIL